MKNSKKWLLIDLIVIMAGIFMDQYTKILIRQKLPLHHYIDVIKDVIQIYHVENGGSAFGMMQNQQTFFMIITVVVLIALSYALIKLPDEKKYTALNIIFSLIFSGAVGNAIDRVQKGTVTDFIYLKIINFAVFNVADIFITCATIALLIMFLFVYKEEDLEFLKREDGKGKKTKKTDSVAKEEGNSKS